MKPVKKAITKMQEPEISFRFERNIVNYPAVFAANYGDDANLILSILGYISSNFRNNIFNYITFTVSDFCKKYGYSKKHLAETHPLFKSRTDEQLLVNKRGLVKPYVSEAGHIYKSVIDHCIYRMMKENVIFSEQIVDNQNFDKLKYVDAQRSLQLLKNVRILNETTRSGSQEYVYELTLGSDILQNMTYRYFIMMKEQSFIELGKNRSGINKRGLFFYLMTEYQRCVSTKIPTNISTPNFNLLCRHAMLFNNQIRNMKQNLIKYLNILGSPNILNFSHNLERIDLDDPNFKITIQFNNVEWLVDGETNLFFTDSTLALEIYFYNHVLGKEKADNDEDYIHKFQLWLNADKSIPDMAKVIQAVYKRIHKHNLPVETIISAIKNNSWDKILTKNVPPEK